MATDGTKIIDGDTAHDTYWGIMDLYDSGAELEMIKVEFPLEQKDYIDEFDHEIYVTSCGLAYWELGLMTPEGLRYIKDIIGKDACVKEWTKYSVKEGKSRKSVLKRYLSKIEKTNENLRKRKKYRKITNFIFAENSVLTFKLSTGQYASTLCAKIVQYRGSCVYWLVPITYRSQEKPTIEKIKGSEILGRTIGNLYTREQVKEIQPGIEHIWKHVGGTPNFMFGFVIHGMEHIDLLKIKDKFEKIGELPIREGLKEIGSLGGVSALEELDGIYSKLNEQTEIFRYKRYPVTSVSNN